MLISPATVTTHTSRTTHTLVKAGSGEFTAASVAANPALAAGLTKLKDGNYAQPIVNPADRASGVDAALTSVKPGG